MKKFLLSALFVALVLPCLAQQEDETINLEEVVLSVPLSKLTVESDGIRVVYQGETLNVLAMETRGSVWLVRAVKWYQCPKGHTRACPICGGCAFMGCDYYCDGYCCKVRQSG